MHIEKANVLGVGVSVLDQDRAREFLFDALRQRRRGYVAITHGEHAEGIRSYLREQTFRTSCNRI